MTVFGDVIAVSFLQTGYVIDEEYEFTCGLDKQKFEHVGIIVQPGLAFVPEDLTKANNTQAVK
jgi:hypothetical protein